MNPVQQVSFIHYLKPADLHQLRVFSIIESIGFSIERNHIFLVQFSSCIEHDHLRIDSTRFFLAQTLINNIRSRENQSLIDKQFLEEHDD